MADAQVLALEEVSNADVALVGGKNASLGQLMRNLGEAGVRVPEGFATTSAAYRTYLDHNELEPVIEKHLTDYHAGRAKLAKAASAIRSSIVAGEWPAQTREFIVQAYRHLCRKCGTAEVDVAVRSSATAEDLPGASFAGQQQTFLNIRGEDALLAACKRCFASLYTERAIAYRDLKGFGHQAIALSIGVQRMVRSDLAGSGVSFSIDTESGFDKVVVISATWGLGETVVQGQVEPDEYQVFKPFLSEPSVVPIVHKRCGAKREKLIYDTANGGTKLVPTSGGEQASYVLADSEIMQLARWVEAIERHYGYAVDVEWAKDGSTGELFIVQARPETGQQEATAKHLRSYVITNKGPLLLQGAAVGQGLASAPVCVIADTAHAADFVDGSILVTRTTDPDWVPIMKRAAAIVTEHGGRTSHAAIVSRELGLPALVGATGATTALHDRQMITVSCAEGQTGFVYDGRVEATIHDTDLSQLATSRTQVMLNLADPAAAYRWWRLPADGVGLTRMEFVIENEIKVHPMALVHFADLPAGAEKAEIDRLTTGYPDKAEYFVDRMSRALARIAAVGHPHPVIIRMSDFKTNEYASLVGGSFFEPDEENPMIGFRGASRYYSPRYKDGFALECRAILRLREELGFRNVIVMIPFCRTLKEADRVLEVMAECGLRRGENGLHVYVMCEIPSNVISAREFAQRFDGFSVGSNDLTQLTLGVDRDSELLAEVFDEEDPAVEWMVRRVIRCAHTEGAKVGLCGQAPSDNPEFARFLVDAGIDSISVTPDSFVAVKRHVAAAEQGPEQHEPSHLDLVSAR